MCLYVRRLASQESLTLTRWLRQSRSTVKMRRAQVIAFSGQGMRARQIAEQRTRTWKRSNDPAYDAKENASRPSTARRRRARR